MGKKLSQILTLYQLFIRLLKFDNSTMEYDYHEAQKKLDTKLYIAFGLVTLIGVVLSGVFILFFTTKETLDYIFLSVQLGLSLLGLLIRNQFPAISKIVILAALPLSFSRYFKLILSAFSESHPVRFYAFGICVGIAQATLSTNFRELKHKLFLIFGLMVVNICANIDGFTNFVNFAGIFAVIILLLASLIYQEILVRRDYKAVYESQEKLQKFKSLLSDDFPIGVLIMSTSELSVLYSNKFFNQNFEEDQLKIKNSTFYKFELEIDPSQLGLSISHRSNDGPFSFSEFLKSLNRNTQILENQNMLVIPAIYRHDSGNTFHYEIKIRSTTWDQVAAYAIIFNDVSEKQLVTALKIADKQKDRILATVSHELRTPINGTLGLLDMIGARITDPLSQAYLNYCRSCNKLLLYLVNSILDLSQLTEDRFRLTQTRFALDELLDEVKSLYLYQCQQKSIEFRIEKDISIPSEVYTDRHRLIQVLINLISNAIKFTFHGSVTLKIERSPEDPWRLKFSVIDTGIGIREEDKAKLFQRFGKIPQANSNINIQGVGLGLAIVQELVAALNLNEKSENIHLESEYEKGSIFSFYVPWKERLHIKVSNQQKEITADRGSESPVFPREMELSFDSIELKLKKYDNKNSTAHKLLGSSYKSLLKSIQKSEVQKDLEEDKLKVQNVLIVDDNPFNILAASFVLEKLHCSIDKAFHGEECLSLLQKKEKLYDLILMDIQMPVMDGVQASRIITEKVKAGELKNVPIVALTAKKSTEEEKKYYEDCGILAVLEKPLNGEKLMSTIESLSSRSP